MKKKLQKKPFIFISISIIVLGIIVTTIFSIVLMFKNSSSKNKGYSFYTIQKEPDYLFKGTVTANTTTDYTKNTALGELSKIDVIDGQKVNIGDILLTYTSSSDDLSSQEFEVKNSKNNLSNAKSDLLEITNKDVALRSKLSKVKDNVEKQEITNQIENNNDAWKTAQRAVTAAELVLDQAQNSLNNKIEHQTVSVTSKTAGTVVMGTDSETSPLLSIVSQDTFVQGEVSEYDYDILKINDSVNIETVDLKRKVTGKISYISPVPEKTNDTSSFSIYKFKVNLDDSLQNGYTVQIHLPNTNLYIPKSAVKSGNVYVKDGNTIKKVKVQTKDSDGRLQIESGVKVGDKLIKEATNYVNRS